MTHDEPLPIDERYSEFQNACHNQIKLKASLFPLFRVLQTCNDPVPRLHWCILDQAQTTSPAKICCAWAVKEPSGERQDFLTPKFFVAVTSTRLQFSIRDFSREHG